jgi:hypothetical protein
MIKPEELRIGNLLKTSSKSLNYAEVATVRKIEPEVIFFEELWAGEYPSGIDGIPLTTEWLEKAGFLRTVSATYSSGEKHDYDVYYLNGFTYNCIQNAWWFGLRLNNQPVYIHQLQNLYYALTGKELEFSK